MNYFFPVSIKEPVQFSLQWCEGSSKLVGNVRHVTCKFCGKLARVTKNGFVISHTPAMPTKRGPQK